ncbi:kinase-like protein [Durotheca rogersii]|uniref:kinase-like protein n=1 Tax=Durotheca rogersii TaxID=419775 RepID=UPI0022208DCD|nr:kinase-like protein [Durotheca rogersii]KAI5862426.1 kinase-like protein [Durotheca rogersii]
MAGNIVEEVDTQSTTNRRILRPLGTKNTWLLGIENVLKSRPDYAGSELEMVNANFARELIAARTNDKFTVPKVVTCRSKGNDFRRTVSIQERVPGESLDNALESLSRAELTRIGAGLGAYLLALQARTSPRMGMLNGQPVMDQGLLAPLPQQAMREYENCRTDDEVAANLGLRLQADLETVAELMARMPPATPFVFTNSDLHAENVMVHKGEFVGLLDWRLAGYYPRWWEYVNSAALLDEYLPAELRHPEALAWFRVYSALRDRPNDEKTRKLVAEYLQSTN